MNKKQIALLDFIDKMEQLGQFQDKVDVFSTISQIWELFLDEIRNYMMIEACALFLVDEKTHEFVLKSAYPGKKEASFCQKEVEYQIEYGMFSWIINRRKPAIIPSFVFKNQKSVIMLPLSTVKRTIGVVFVLTPIEENAITQENLKLLTMLAKQCSLVMENSILYNQSRKEHKALQKAQNQVLQVEKLASIGRLTYGVSHEILNPLNIISGHIQLLLMNSDINGNIRKPLRIIKSQTRRITEIINGLAQFSRHSNHVKTKLSINDLINKFVLMAENKIKDNNINVIKDLDQNLPSIMGDKENLSQTLFFLLSNAKDAMPKGGTIRITTEKQNGDASLEKPGNFIRIAFQDNGVGISGENISKIFDPFFTTNMEERRGLGLSLGFGIIQDHGGTMKVVSQINQGTTVLIYLPI